MADKISYNDLFEGNLKKEIADLKKMLSDLDKQMVGLKKSGGVDYSNSGNSLKKLNDTAEKAKKNTKELNALDKEREKITRQVQQAQAQLQVVRNGELKGLDDLKKKKKELISIQGTEENSIARLRAENRKLTQERNAVNTSTEAGRKRIEELNNAINKNNDTIKANLDNQGKLKMNIGNYKDGVKQAIQETGLMPPVLQKASTGMKLFNAVVKANPIGLLVTALGVVVGSLASFFTQTERGERMFERFKATVGAAVDVLKDGFSSFGETIVRAFTNPKEAISGLWMALKTNIVNKIEGVIDLFGIFGNAIRAVFERDLEGLKQAGRDAGQAMIQLTTGMDEEQQKKFGNSVKGVVNDIKEESNAALELKQRMQDLEDLEIDFITRRGQMRAKIAEYRKEAQDESNSALERQKAINEAIKLQQELTTAEIQMAKEKANIIKEQIALGESSTTDRKNLAEAENRVNELQREQDTIIKTLLSRQKSINKEVERGKQANDEFAISLEDVNDNIVQLDAGLPDTVSSFNALKETLDELDISLIEPESERDKLDKALEELKAFYEQGGMAHEEYARLKGEIDTRIKEEELQKRQETLTKINDDIQQVGNVSQTFSDARIANIEAEKNAAIKAAGDDAEARAAAEEKFNARILAERKKAARVNLVLNIAQIISDTALASIRIWAQPGFPLAIPFQTLIAAQGVAQVAKAKAEYNKIQSLEKGGELKGARHKDGGISIDIDGRQRYEAEGGEFIINRKAFAGSKNLVKAINNMEITEDMVFGRMIGKSKGQISYKKELGEISANQKKLISLTGKHSEAYDDNGRRVVRSINGNKKIYV